MVHGCTKCGVWVFEYLMYGCFSDVRVFSDGMYGFLMVYGCFVVHGCGYERYGCSFCLCHLTNLHV